MRAQLRHSRTVRENQLLLLVIYGWLEDWEAPRSLILSECPVAAGV